MKNNEKRLAQLRIAYEKNFQKLAHCDRNYLYYKKREKELNQQNIRLLKELGRGS